MILVFHFRKRKTPRRETPSFTSNSFKVLKSSGSKLGFVLNSPSMVDPPTLDGEEEEGEEEEGEEEEG